MAERNIASRSIDISPPGGAVLANIPQDVALKRGRGLSTSSSRSVNLPSQKSLRGASPREYVPALPSAEPHSGELPARRPSLPYSHHRQPSHAREATLPRSSSHATLKSESTSPMKPSLPLMMRREASGNAQGPGVSPPRATEYYPIGGQSGVPSTMNSTLNGIQEQLQERAAAEDVRRLERMYGGNIRKESHLRSHSKQMTVRQEPKPVSEYAMHHLFNSFVQYANHKIQHCITTSYGLPEPEIESICGLGADQEFDKLLQAMGHVARHEPKLLIRSATEWARTQAVASRDKSAIAAQAEGLLFNTSSQPSKSFLESSESKPVTNDTRTIAPIYDLEAVAIERRKDMADYLWCRILVDTLAQSTLKAITPSLMDSLQGLIYRKLKTYTHGALEKSPIKRANWRVYGQLIAVTSELNFNGLSSRLRVDLAASQKVLGEKGYTDRAAEAETLLILSAMRNLRLGHSTPDIWAESYEFVQYVANYFGVIHGQLPKQAYCMFLEALLLPVAAKGTKETNDPTWRRVVRAISERVSQLSSKPKYWHQAAPLQTVLMCVSPSDTFASKWQPILSSLQSKLRDPRSRSTALKLISRLVWSYLRDNIDSQHATTLMLEDITRSVFFSGRKFPLSIDPSIAEPIIQLIRFIGYKDTNFCFQSIVFPLLYSDMFSSSKDLKIEQFEPARIVIGIKSCLAIMGDLERKERPPFPLKFADETPEDALGYIQIPPNSRYKGQYRQTSTVKEERLSRPVITAGFSEVTKDQYNRFCGILGKIVIMCDNAFGGQAVLDERFASTAPKTPVAEAFAFNRKDETSAEELRHGFYDLLHVAVQALPRFMSADIPFNSIINLLCTGTAHVEKNIASSSSKSLKSIARQTHSQQVTVGFARFIFKYNNRYSTMSDGGMLGPNHIDNTLNLYVELLQIWIEEIQQRAQKGSSGQQSDKPALDLSSLWTHIEEVESHGLFFLCSPSTRVRAIAVEVLRLLRKFDTALGKENARIVQTLERGTQAVIDVDDERLTIVERSRLLKGLKRADNNSMIIELCASDAQSDVSLWNKLFPSLIRTCFEECPHAVTLARSLICERLSQMHPMIESLDGRTRTHQNPSHDLTYHRGFGRTMNAANEMIIEQWKLYLTFACITLTKTGSQQQTNGHEISHIRKTSKSSQASSDAFDSATDLFLKIVPMLSSDNAVIREAAVCGLGSINLNLYKTLLETLEKSTAGQLANQRNGAMSPGRYRYRDNLRTEVTHIYKLTSHFLQNTEVSSDEWILTTLVTFSKELGIFLGDTEVQKEWTYQRLRIHYCGLIEGLFTGVNSTHEPLRWMPFQTRKAAFALLEGWCGCAPDRGAGRSRDDSTLQSSSSPERIFQHSMTDTQAARDKKDLRTAALKAMSNLCCGPLRINVAGNKSLQFDVGRMLAWIDTIFRTESDKFHTIGRRALKNLITYNREHEILLDRSLDMLYQPITSKGLESYLEVVRDVLPSSGVGSPPLWKIFVAGLYFLGDNQNSIRTKSARLLRVYEDEQGKLHELKDLEISISDKTTAVFKKAQFDTSQRLAQVHPELAFYMLSEFCRTFKDLHPDRQRIMVPAMLPWARILELQIMPGPEKKPTDETYMLLINLFEITIRCSSTLPNEIAAFWQALVAGPYQGNVQMIMEFVIDICLESKDHSFLEYSKQIIVHLSEETGAMPVDRSTTRRQKIVDFLLQKLTPQALTYTTPIRSVMTSPQNTSLPYIVDASQLPQGNREYTFSFGQICLVFLVDLIVPPIHLGPEKLPVLLQMVFILWDHHAPLLEDQAREMLVHLIHDLVISRGTDPAIKSSAEDLIEMIRYRDPKIVWEYSESVAQFNQPNTPDTPLAMSYVVNLVSALFESSHIGIRDAWGRTAMHWATTSLVHHSACRSLQLFRCMINPLDEIILNNMLSRLGKTIGDHEINLQVYCVEILRTLGLFIDCLDASHLIALPKVFWTIFAVLGSPVEFEFLETLVVLQKYLDKMDLAKPDILSSLAAKGPVPEWISSSSGIAQLVYRGCKSKIGLEPALRVLDHLIRIPANPFIGGPERLLYTCLASLPHFLHSLESAERQSQLAISANNLAQVAIGEQHEELAHTLFDFSKSQTKDSRDLLHRSMTAIKSSFLPEFELGSLLFLIGLLSNEMDGYKVQVLRMLSILLPSINLRMPEIVAQGPDLLSPLLRLLSTDFSAQALNVLDLVRTNLQGSDMDTQYMRMSIGGPDPSAALRKQHATTKSLYGIPEKTGWSIPMPSIQKDVARRNLQLLHEPPAAESTLTAINTEVEFTKEELHYVSGAADNQMAILMNDAPLFVENAGEELVSKLDSLDDFFDDDGNDEETSPDNFLKFSTEAHMGENIHEKVYDHQTAPILKRTLNRNASITSVNISPTDLRSVPAREPHIMSPSAFTASKTPPRPSLAQRSITSPAFQRQSPPRSEYVPADMSTDEPFSDDDYSLSRTSTNGSLVSDQSLRPMPRSRPSLRTGMRTGIKRLTGIDRHRLATRPQMEDSPEVPKVPDEYLRIPKSTEL